MIKVKKQMDICFDKRGPSVVIEVDAYKNGYTDIRKRAGKIRAFTEITPDNVHYCKELVKIVDELRHLGGVKGGFAVSETEYMATSILEEAKPLTQVIYSNVPEMVKQGHYVFDTFWNIAIPAEYRIRQIDEGIEPEKTEVIYPYQDIIETALHDLRDTSKSLDLCGDSNGPIFLVSNEKIMQRYTELKNNGVRIRLMAEITKENISHCRKVMKFSELRHLDGLKSNFGINDKRTFGCVIVARESKEPLHFIHSNVKELVEQQQYIFDTLWTKAVPAEQRIREIEEGLEPEIIETLREPYKVQTLGHDLIKLAKVEILILFHTSNAFHRQERAGAIQLLLNAAVEHDVRTRILVPVDGRIKEVNAILKEQSQGKIEIRNVEPTLHTRISMLIVDRKYSLSVELKDDTRETSLDAMGMATYTNSKATVLSYVSIFESLWNQTELYEQITQLYEQLKMHAEMQKEFINIAAHELRTPIQPIIGLTDILSQESVSGNELRNFLEIINRNAKRLNKLSEDLLDVARIEGQSLQLNKKTFNLSDTIREAVADIEKSTSKGKLSFLHSEQYILVNADRDRVAQVISNLLNNAIKFTEEGDVFITVQRQLEDHRPVLVVTVKDTGTGIDREILPRLFTKFVTKSEKGTGLGLFISKGIVEAHGGKIWATNNKDGRGATFSFTLPVN